MNNSLEDAENELNFQEEAQSFYEDIAEQNDQSEEEFLEDDAPFED